MEEPDFSTGEPLVAQVKIHQMHSDLVGPRLTETCFGTYYRLTRPGAFTVTASCDGFLPETKSVAVAGG